MIRHDSRRVSVSIRTITAAVIVTVVAAFTSVTRASSVPCGATIVEDLRLDDDMSCTGTALVVGADGIKINLQGHTITGTGVGAGAGAGINVTGHTDVTIFGGTIESFFTGVLVINSSDVVVKDMLLRNHVDGVDLQAGSTGITIKASEFVGNTTRGIMMRTGSTDIDVKGNTFTANRVGILLFGPTNATVKDNTIASSTLAGIRVNAPATGNLVLANTVTSNPAGIEFLIVSGAGATGNAFIANTIAMNTCGLKGPGSANTYQENQFVSNTTDICS